MRFEVGLPGGIDVWALQAAGLDPDEFLRLSMEQFEEKKGRPLPATVRCRCRKSDRPMEARVTVFGFGEHEEIDRWLDKSGKIVVKRGRRPDSATEIRVEIANEKIGRT